MNKKFLCLVKFVIWLSFVVGASATALGEEFYKGKTILFTVGTPPGGGYDTYTRAVARHIGKLHLQQGQTGRPNRGGLE